MTGFFIVLLVFTAISICFFIPGPIYLKILLLGLLLLLIKKAGPRIPDFLASKPMLKASLGILSAFFTAGALLILFIRNKVQELRMSIPTITEQDEALARQVSNEAFDWLGKLSIVYWFEVMIAVFGLFLSIVLAKAIRHKNKA